MKIEITKWKRDFFTIWTGQAVSLITSAILQMAIIFYLTGSIMSLTMSVGLILSGFFADRIGVNHWFLISGIFIIGIALICPFIPAMRGLDEK